MLHFFRKIRRDLLANSQFFKYLKYAIGEIVLVVLGILIALYINNLNEQRKSEKRVKLLFHQVQKELLYNISRTNYIINYYVYKDSLFYKVIKGNIDYNDYTAQRSFMNLITRFDVEVEVEDNAIRQLIESEESFTPEQDSLVNRLRNLYGLDLLKVRTQNDILKKMVNDFRQKLKDEKPWYSELNIPISASRITPQLSEEIVSYFLIDPYYLNEVQDFINAGYQAHLKYILGFRTSAINVHKEISYYLDKTADLTPIPDFDSNFLGSYENEKMNSSIDDKNVEVVIERKKDALWIHIYENGAFLESIEAFPYSKDSFIGVFGRRGGQGGVLNKFRHNEKTKKNELILIGDFGYNGQKRPKYVQIN
ncbi:MAG: hypothetical protein JSV73_09245 [Flavobacteriaceae bacterium]|nr:MAG: hypothetical protein JSV73_09245 [Flavobacteriaceae bacterium]